MSTTTPSREQKLRDEARNQESLAQAAARDLAAAVNELNYLNDRMSEFQSTTTTLVSRKDALIASIDTQENALNDPNLSAEDRAHFKDQLAKDQKELESVTAQIRNNEALQKALQDELAAAVARVKQQARIASPTRGGSTTPPVQEPGSLPVQEPGSPPVQEPSPPPAQQPNPPPKEKPSPPPAEEQSPLPLVRNERQSKCNQCTRDHAACTKKYNDLFYAGCVADANPAYPGDCSYMREKYLDKCRDTFEQCRRDFCR